MESTRIAEQLRHAFTGNPWHGYPLHALVKDLNCRSAVSKPVPGGHNVWEILLHIDIYVRAAKEALQGIPLPHLWGSEADWPVPEDTSEAAWSAALIQVFLSADELAAEVEAISDAHLKQLVPGRDYDFYHLLHGIIQHSLYHAGQIAMITSAEKAVNRD